MSFFKDLWGSFTGKSQRKDLAEGKAASDKALSDGLQQGQAGYDAGIQRLDPYATGGKEGLDAYIASLGLRGDPARKEVQDAYFRDPIQNTLMDRITKANTRAATGVGMGNSGAATQSLTNAFLSNYSAHQDRLKGVGDTGMQAAGGQSQLESGKGDMAFGYGQQKAGNAITYSNALAQSRGTTLNNLFKIGGLAVQAATGTPKKAA